MNNLFRSICHGVRLVWRLLSPAQRFSLAAASLLMAVAAWMNAQIPIALGNLATDMALAKEAGKSWGLVEARPFLLTLAIFFLCREGIQVLRKFLVHRTTTQIEKEISVKLVDHLLQLDLLSFSQEKIGALHGRIRRNVEGISRMLMLSFMDFLPAILTAGFAIAVAIQRNVLLGFLMAAVVPVVLFIVTRQITSQMGIRVEFLRKKEDMDGTVVEQLGGIEYLRAANMHRHEVKRVEQIAEALRAKEMRHHIAMAYYDCAKAWAEGAFFLTTIATAIVMAAKGIISVGEILTVAMLYGCILGPMREVHRIVDEAAESSLKVQDLGAMLSQPKDFSFAADGKETPKMSLETPVISSCDLKLQYATAGGNIIQVLNGITTEIRYGEIVGIAGRTGCGKSTWIKMLLRLLHPNSGSLLLGGIRVEKVSRENIGKMFAYVGQNPFVFAGTIAENIKYGAIGATMEKIQEVAKFACVHDDIMAMPENYQTLVSERGQTLSGGQRQRIAIARALLQSRPILILDEATSALDNISEAKVLTSLTTMKEKPTVLMVAHRITTLRNADKILVFGAGRIVQEGNYDDLVSIDGVFKELAQSGSNHESRD